MDTEKNIRGGGREPVSAVVELHWEDAHGSGTFARGVCVEVSDTGLKVLLDVPLEPGTQVDFRIDSLKLYGAGTVRHCRHPGPRYTIGLAISSTRT